MLSVLRDKHQLLKEDGEALSVNVRQAATSIRSVKAGHAEACRNAEQVLEDCRQCLADVRQIQAASSSADGQSLSPMERLRADAVSALHGDATTLQSLLDMFTQQVLSKSGTNASSLAAAGNANSTAVAASSKKLTEQRISKAEEAARQLTKHVADEINQSGSTPIVVPKVLRPKSPRAGRQEWIR